MIFAATGHRPDKLGGYSESASNKLCDFAVLYLARTRPTECISGVALGWDTAFAQAALLLDIPLTAAIPFDGQHRMRSPAQQSEYRRILDAAARTVTVSPGGFSVRAMHKRNEWMVNNCDQLIALFDGSPGGTRHCMYYAEGKRRPIVNLWDQFQRF